MAAGRRPAFFPESGLDLVSGRWELSVLKEGLIQGVAVGELAFDALPVPAG
ncbi:MAG: hypothetical protein H5U02_02370 [Clostridia bacterium]|nr:hypothetical protein [Clostridia bacterium]